MSIIFLELLVSSGDIILPTLLLLIHNLRFVVNKILHCLNLQGMVLKDIHIPAQGMTNGSITLQNCC